MFSNNYILSKVFLFVCIPPNHYTQSLTLVTCGIYGFYWAYMMGKAAYTIKSQRNLPASDSSVVYLILQIFGLGIIVYALAQNEINDFVSTN